MTAIDRRRAARTSWPFPTEFLTRTLAYARRPVNIGPLIVLRIAFGLVMFAGMIRFMARGWIRELYVLPQFHFGFSGFEWLRPLPEAGMWLVFVALALLSLCIAAGFAYRLSMVGFTLLFTYIELLDKAYYLNHYYFVSVLALLMIFLPLNGALSIDSKLGIAPARSAVPAWMLWAVRLQLALVYFFAGLAKLNPDWLLQGQPMQIWLRARTATPLIGQYFDLAWVPLAMSWAGALFDLTIPFWLSWRSTRLPAYFVVVVFHLMTGLLFPIGMFPWLMIGCTLVFFDWQVRPAESDRPNRPKASSSTSWRPALTGVAIVMFLLIQLALPLRHFFIPGDVNWTEEGGRFAWRVMLVEKTGSVIFHVREEVTGRQWTVYPGDYLTQQQEQQMSFQPDMILQFAHFVGRQHESPVSVTATAYVSWNGRTSRLLLDPSVDLMAVSKPPIVSDRPH